jgi:hypothetical protein
MVLGKLEIVNCLVLNSLIIKLVPSNSMPPTSIKIPAEANILICRLLDDFEAYIEPIAQNIELKVSEMTPNGFNVKFVLNGFTRIIRPANPATSPNIVFRVSFCFKTRAPNSAIHSGIVEFNNAVIPDDRYCAPQTNNP